MASNLIRNTYLKEVFVSATASVRLREWIASYRPGRRAKEAVEKGTQRRNSNLVVPFAFLLIDAAADEHCNSARSFKGVFAHLLKKRNTWLSQKWKETVANINLYKVVCPKSVCQLSISVMRLQFDGTNAFHPGKGAQPTNVSMHRNRNPLKTHCFEQMLKTKQKEATSSKGHRY